MVKTRRYLIPRINQAEKEFKHLLDEGLVLVQALILQQSGTNSERFKTLPIRNVSIDSLNDVLVTLKNLVKKKIHFLDDYINMSQDAYLDTIEKNPEFTEIIRECKKLNLISDNSTISLYLSPYINNWNLLSAGCKLLIINHIVKSINREMQRIRMMEKTRNNIKF